MACRDVWNTWPSGLRSPQKPPASPSGFVVTGGPRAMYFTHHGKPWLKPIAITWIIHLRAISHEKLMSLIRNMCFKLQFMITTISPRGSLSKLSIYSTSKILLTRPMLSPVLLLFKYLLILPRFFRLTSLALGQLCQHSFPKNFG